MRFKACEIYQSPVAKAGNIGDNSIGSPDDSPQADIGDCNLGNADFGTFSLVVLLRSKRVLKCLYLNFIHL